VGVCLYGVCVCVCVCLCAYKAIFIYIISFDMIHFES